MTALAPNCVMFAAVMVVVPMVNTAPPRKPEPLMLTRSLAVAMFGSTLVMTGASSALPLPITTLSTVKLRKALYEVSRESNMKRT